MFISVDLPAPFSPRSAWISPRRSCRSTPSLAVTAPKRLTMPRSSAASSAGPSAGGVGGATRPSLLKRARDFHLAGRDLLLDIFDLLLVLMSVGGYLAEAAAAALDVEDAVAARLERVVLHGLDRVEDRRVDALHGAGEDV